MKFNPIRSEKFEFNLNVGNQRFSLFKLQFQKRDGSVLIHVPYLKESKGVLSLCTFPAEVTHVDEISRVNEAKVTSHLVKLSHHPDGKAHFSQDGRILTTVRNQSTALAEINGHMFSITTKGYPLRENKRTKKDTKSLEFYLEASGFLPSIKVQGHYYARPRVDIQERIEMEQSGHLMQGYSCSAPENYPLSTSVLLVGVSVFPYSSPNEMDFTLIGGFGPNNSIDDDLRFLAMSYPEVDYETLKMQIGSADLS